MGCAQSMQTNLDTMIDDETDCRDDCAPLNSHCATKFGSAKWRGRSVLCASPARPPRMPRRSVSCGNAQAVIDEEIHVEAARRWLPVDKDQQRVCVGDKSVHKQNFIHSQLSEHEDPVQMKEKQAELVKQYDLNKMHLPLHEPFLGSMYWTPATRKLPSLVTWSPLQLVQVQ